MRSGDRPAAKGWRVAGVIGAGDFATRPVLTSYDADIIKAATYAVTLEQPGGSPDGKPTLAPVETVPPAAPAR
jgi:anti-sigma-K factor RskA